MTSLHEDFRAACAAHAEFDSETVDLAQQVLERCHSAILDVGTFGHGLPAQDEVAKRHCFACILFISKGIREGSRGHRLPEKPCMASLSGILHAFDVGLEEFLKELPTVIKRAEPNLGSLLVTDAPLARRLKLRELQTSFVYTTVLAKKSKDLFRSYFDLSITGQGATDKASPFYAAWLLFVTAKSKLLPVFPDLVASFNLLICVLNVAIMHIPESQRNVDLNDQSLFPVRTETGGADTLQSLCLVNKANLTAVRALMHGMDNMLKAAAKSVPPPSTTVAQPASNMVTSCSYLPGFMSQSDITAAVAEKLNTEYQQACASSLDVDERPFLGKAAEAPPTPGPSAAPPSLSRCIVGSPQRTLSSSGQPRMVYLSPVTKNRSAGPLQTPSPKGRNPISIFGLAQTPGMPGLMSGFPGTPVSDAMTAASWLHDMSLRHPQQPTPQLQRFFAACDYDMTELVAARIEQMAQAVFPLVSTSQHALQALQAAMSNERRQQGVKLYYNVLEAMLTAEESRTHRTNFHSLLSSNSFHKCLAACAFELIVASYKMVTHAFPAVLEKLELHAFDMCKIIDSFVRYEPSTPRDLKRHLHSIEEKIVECLAWERGSSLYPLLVAACENQENQDTEAEPGREDGHAKEVAPTHPVDSPQSQPNTPTKRKTFPAAAQPSTSNKSHKGNDDSSPSRHDMGTKPATAAQQTEMVEATGDGAEEAAAEPAATTSGNLVAITPQRSVAADDAMQTPKRAALASAFSVFMTPSGSGSHGLSGNGPAATAMLPKGFDSMITTVSYSDKPGRHILQEFLRKVLKLAANRLHDLCSRLDIEDANREEIETQVYHLMQHVIFKQTSLLYNRHLDQVLLSAVYGVCKVAQLKQISFKQIINHYRRQPQAKSDIFRTVVLKQTDVQMQVLHTGDVIAFYNSVFVPAVKTDLLKINQDRASLARPPATESLTGASPIRSFNRPDFPPDGFSTPPAASRALHGLSQRPSLHKVSATKQVFVSPLRQSSPMQAPAMTPRTRSLYACMGKSQQPYQSPSKDLDLINGRISGRLPQVIGVQGGSGNNSGSTGQSSMEAASQSPSVSNSRGDLLRQSSTVSGEATNGSGALQVLRAAAARADQWKAASAAGHAGEPDAAQADEESDSQGTDDSSHAGMTKAQTEQLA